MSSRNTTDDRWSQLSRNELVALGKTLVTERLESLGCTVTPPSRLLDGKLDVRTPSERSAEVFVSTQRVGGYVFWTKQRLQPASNRFAAIVLLADGEDPELYLVPSTAWRSASPPLKDRDYVGKKSEPEYRISLARSSLPSLQRYGWDEPTAKEHFASGEPRGLTSPAAFRATSVVQVRRPALLDPPEPPDHERDHPRRDEHGPVRPPIFCAAVYSWCVTFGGLHVSRRTGAPAASSMFRVASARSGRTD